MDDAVSVNAPAKINLALSVGPPVPADFPDAGLHPIASWMIPIDLCDEISLRPNANADLELARRWADDAPAKTPLAWPKERDLTLLALNALSKHIGRDLNAGITLTKRIPVGGGLGGGSSDAAACLIAANTAFGLDLTTEELAEIGHGIGSDIPFFLDIQHTPRPALVTDFGRAMGRTAPVHASMLLIVPNFGCSTPEVYHEYDQSALTLDEARVAQMAGAGEVNPAELFNDLALPALRAEPRLRELVERVRRLIAEPVHVSGSGSTLFVITQSPESLANELGPQLPGARCLAARASGLSDGGR